MKKWQKWSDEENEILKEWYPKIGTKVAKMLPGRTVATIKTRAHVLKYSGENKHPGKPWTTREIKIIRDNYDDLGKDISRLLPGRSDSAIYTKAHSMGIGIKNNTWSKEEENILIANYPEMGSSVSSLLPNKTKEGIMQKANTMKIYYKKYPVTKPWSEDEIKILYEYYPDHGTKKCLELLPNRTGPAIYTKVHDLGISRNIVF